jgi:hypothetical protein
VGELEVRHGNGRPRAFGPLDQKEKVEEVLRVERAALRAQPRNEGRAFVESAERHWGPERAPREEVPRHPEPAHDLEHVRRRRGALKPVSPALRGTKTPGEPKRAGPVELGMTHGTGIYIPVRRSSASLRSIFLRAAMALRLRLAEGFS